MFGRLYRNRQPISSLGKGEHGKLQYCNAWNVEECCDREPFCKHDVNAVAFSRGYEADIAFLCVDLALIRWLIMMSAEDKFEMTRIPRFAGLY